MGKGKQQVLDSKRKLLRVKYRTDQDVTSVHIAGDDRENQHKIQEELTRQVRCAVCDPTHSSSAWVGVCKRPRW